MCCAPASCGSVSSLAFSVCRANGVARRRPPLRRGENGDTAVELCANSMRRASRRPSTCWARRAECREARRRIRTSKRWTDQQVGADSHVSLKLTQMGLDIEAQNAWSMCAPSPPGRGHTRPSCASHGRVGVPEGRSTSLHADSSRVRQPSASCSSHTCVARSGTWHMIALGAV